jgi:hypothetical protein
MVGEARLDGSDGAFHSEPSDGLSVRPYVSQPVLVGQHLDHVAWEIHRAISQGLERRGGIEHPLAYPLAECLLQVARHESDIGSITVFL